MRVSLATLDDFRNSLQLGLAAREDMKIVACAEWLCSERRGSRRRIYPTTLGPHSNHSGSVVEVSPCDAMYATPLAIEPAGDASLSPQDCGRFLQLHLRGLRGRDDVLKGDHDSRPAQ
jgi:hypothetical protein